MRNIKDSTAFWLLFACAVFLRWDDLWLWPSRELLDETTYIEAGRAVLRGQSPYDGRYLYPPFLAEIVSRLLQIGGETFVREILRIATGISIFALARNLCALAFGRMAYIPIALGLLLIPGVDHAARLGNVSIVVAALVLSGVRLLFWTNTWEEARTKLPLGFLCLLLATVIKPVAAPALVLGMYACWRDIVRFLRSLNALDVTWIFPYATFFFLATRNLRWFGDMVSQFAPHHRSLGNVSLIRVAHMVGLDLSPTVLLVVVTLIALWLATYIERIDFHGRMMLTSLATGASALSAAVLWDHVTLVALPALVMAWNTCGPYWQIRPLRLLLTIISGVSVIFLEGFGGAPVAGAVQVLLTAVPLAGLTWLGVCPFVCLHLARRGVNLNVMEYLEERRRN